MAVLVMLAWKSGFFASHSDHEVALLKHGMALHAALHNYEVDQKAAPKRLVDLVPNYLEHVPFFWPNSDAEATLFQLVPRGPSQKRSANDDLLLSSPFASPGKAGMRQVYVQEDGDVGLRRITTQESQ